MSDVEFGVLPSDASKPTDENEWYDKDGNIFFYYVWKRKILL